MPSNVIERLSPTAARVLADAWARRTFVGVFVGIVVVLAVVTSLLLPTWYRAGATILPPLESGDQFGLMSGMIETSALNRLGLLSTSTPSDVFAEILKSRRLHEELVQEFDLESRYKREGMDRTLKELSRHISVDVNAAGLIVLHVEDRDPETAAAMTNHLMESLDRFNREALNTRAKRTRQFLEERLADVNLRMQVADSTLTAYEEEHKVVASSGAIQEMASVIADKLSLQVQRSYLQSYSNPDNPELRALNTEIAAFEHELGRLPAMKNEGARLALDAEIQRKVFSLLTAQYEDARIQERRDTPTVTVLDQARPPEIRARPKRTLIVAVSTVLAIALALGWIALTPRGVPQP